MATVHIRGVPENLYLRLKAYANTAGKSINQSAIEILQSSPQLTSRLSLTEIARQGEIALADSQSVAKAAKPAAELIREDRDAR